MAIYLTIFVLLVVFGFLEIFKVKENQKKLLIFAIFVLLVLLDGLRWETGTDWILYRDYFLNSTKEKWMAFEPGYVLLNQVIHIFSNNYTVFLILFAILIYSLYLKSIADIALYPLITSLLFFCAFIGYMGMNRQHVALAICLYSFRYIISKEFWSFSLCVLLAALFHRTASIFFVVYFLNRSIPAHIFLLSLIVVYLLNPVIASLVKPFVSAMPSTIAFKLNEYLKSDDSNSTLSTIVGTMKRALIFLPLYYHKNKIKLKYPGIELMLNIYFLSLLIYVLFNNSIQVFVSRGNLYFGTLFEIFLIPYFFVLVKNNYSQVILYFFIVIFSLMTLIKSLSILSSLFIPYKGIFINSEFSRVLF